MNSHLKDLFEYPIIFEAEDIRAILKRYLTNGEFSGEEHPFYNYEAELRRWKILFRNILQQLMEERRNILRNAPDNHHCRGVTMGYISRQDIRDYIKNGGLFSENLIAGGEEYDGREDWFNLR